MKVLFFDGNVKIIEGRRAIEIGHADAQSLAGYLATYYARKARAENKKVKPSARSRKT